MALNSIDDILNIIKLFNIIHKIKNQWMKTNPR